MMAAVHAKGRTTIENAAKEPEIIDVATLLNKMGANIRGAGTNVITIDGVDQLAGCFHEIIPDRIEAATYIVLAAAAAKEVRIDNIIPHHLEALLSKLKEIGTDLEIGVDNVCLLYTSQAITEAQLVILVLDSSRALDAQDEELLELTKDKTRIIVYNKTDISNQQEGVCISAASGERCV